MNDKEYIESVLVTEARDFGPVAERLSNISNIRLLHSAIGLCTESGEIQDALKKAIFYGKPLDKTNLVEELGDLMWYIGIACSELGVTLEEVKAKNIAKLKARYGAKFTEAAALNRDLKTERDILEQK